jgi:EmrB/QacA subfamily drug resistance transporter
MALLLERPSRILGTHRPEPQGLSTIGLGILLLGAFLPIVDFFIVNVALPTIDATLHASPATLELIVAGYGTAYALLLVVGGRLGDMFGRRSVFMVGLAGFTMTSLLCGLAPNVDLLIGARILQAAAAALIVPQVLATFQATLEGERRARALGLYGATAGIATVTGQLFGGLLVSANIAGTTWRPIFLVNVPIGIVALLLARRVVPDTRSERPASIDYAGTALFGLTMLALLLPLTEGHSLGWPSWTWVLLALAPVFALCTVAVERHHERHGRLPLLPPSLLRFRSMRRGLILGLPFFMGFGAFMFIFALTMQDGLHASALRSGLAITPMAVMFLTGSLLAPKVIARYGRLALGLGSLVQGIGLVTTLTTFAAQWPHVSLWALAPGLAITGFGQAFVFGALFRLVLADVPQHLAGVGGGVLVTLQQSGLALGVATLGSLFISLEHHGFDVAYASVLGINALVVFVLAASSRLLPKGTSAELEGGAVIEA